MRIIAKLAALAAGATLLCAPIPAAAAAPTPAPLTVALVQADLKAKGAPVNVTGVMDRPTQNALDAQSAHTVGQLDAGAPDATVLQPGSSGPAVKLVQQALRSDGYAAAKPSGAYDAATAQAVGEFQRGAGLPATGDLDTKTLWALVQPDPQRTIAPAAPTMSLVATAYGPSLKDNFPYGPVDLAGKPLVAGDVAVDPRVIPIGTRLWVSGYSSPSLPKGGFVAVAADTGDAIQGQRMDIFVNGGPAAVSAFGVQHVTATVMTQ
ncbi:MAG TPA: peptidoglycan-binding protein [Bacillota bacterium]|nr:peptidoglycan-binding protein [Bacillota bacterium]